MAAPPVDPSLGSFVGHFRLLSLIGEGGMGRVYLAEQPRIGKRVAVKLLRPELVPDRGALQRFFREAQLVNQIRDEHIIDIIDLGETEGGVPYLVMEHLVGESLAARLRRGRLDEATARHVGAQVAATLAAVHAVAVTHRDLKPDNIFLVQRGEDPSFVKLLDFGIAKPGAGGPAAAIGAGAAIAGSDGAAGLPPTLERLTTTGTLLGTPLYMSPEQLRAEPVGPATDIYALGCVLFEMVAGRPPFLGGGSLAAVLAAHLFEAPPPLASFCPQVSSTYAAVVARCLEKEPACRYGSAAELATDLRTGLAPTPQARRPGPSAPELPAATPGPPEATGPRTVTLSLRTAGLAGGALLIVAAMATLALLRPGRVPAVPTVPPPPSAQATPAPPGAPGDPNTAGVPAGLGAPGSPAAPLAVLPAPAAPPAAPSPVAGFPGIPAGVPVMSLPRGRTDWVRLGLVPASAVTGGAAKASACPERIATVAGENGSPIVLELGAASGRRRAKLQGLGFVVDNPDLWCTGGFTLDMLSLICQQRVRPAATCGATYRRAGR